MKYPRIEIPEFAEFLSNCSFQKSDVKQFLTKLEKKYANDIAIKHKVRIILRKHNIKIPYHSFFSIQDKYSIIKADKSKSNINYLISKYLNLSQKYEIKEKQLKHKIVENFVENEFYLENTFGNIFAHYEIKKKYFSKDNCEKIDVFKQLREYEINDIESIGRELINLILNKVIYRIRYELRKLKSEEETVENTFKPFIQSSEKGFEKIKLSKAPGKIILIKSR
jgi:hypothetical protein